MILIISSCFYTLFLFDTLGMSEGFAKAYWVLIFMPLVPLFDYIVYRLLVRMIRAKKVKYGSKGGDNSEHKVDSEIVMIDNPI